MRVLFDHSAPPPLRTHLKAHFVTEAKDLEWDRLISGDLLARAEADGFEGFVIADRNIRYRQNLAGRKIAIVVIGNAQWRILKDFADRLTSAVNEAKPGSYAEVSIPLQQR